MRGNSVYLAARYAAKEKVAELADKLEAEGFDVTSTWCRRSDDEPDLAAHRAAAEAGGIADIGRQFAEEDLDDILQADILVLLSCWGVSRRGGMFVEVGVALGHQMPTVLVGPRTNVFDALHTVEVAGPDDLLGALHDLIEGA